MLTHGYRCVLQLDFVHWWTESYTTSWVDVLVGGLILAAFTCNEKKKMPSLNSQMHSPVKVEATHEELLERMNATRRSDKPTPEDAHNWCEVIDELTGNRSWVAKEQTEAYYASARKLRGY